LRLEGRTVVILTGAALGLIGDACAIARDLQPAMVVLEDVDLVAQERTAMGFGATSLLSASSTRWMASARTPT
jgi:hypothetical protein